HEEDYKKGSRPQGKEDRKDIRDEEENGEARREIGSQEESFGRQKIRQEGEEEVGATLMPVTAAWGCRAHAARRAAPDPAPARPARALVRRTRRDRAHHRSRSGCAPSRAWRYRQSCSRHP